MTRLIVHVEGQTEEMFVKELLKPYLLDCGFTDVSVRLVGNARQRSKRFGIKPWFAVRKEICNHLKSDANVYSTTIVDYYALPEDWPGRLAANPMTHIHKASHIENELSKDIVNRESFSISKRFIPFVLMHEFEALLFSDCNAFANAIGRPELATKFQEIRNQFKTPEHINDSPITAPSKRVEKLVPQYQKPIFGNIAALEIGIKKIKNECAHFSAWLTALEQLPFNNSTSTKP